MNKILIKIILIITLFFPIIVNAEESGIVIDADSGRILYEKNINDKHLIASTTKIMTALIAIENGKLKQTYKVGNEITKVYGSSMYLSLDEELKLKDLLYGLLLRSGNDAAVVIINNVTKNEKEFVSLMNIKAKTLNLKNTYFYNPHGLDNETKNISTAYDLAIIMKEAMNNNTFKKITKSKKYIFKSNMHKYTLYNKNSLLKTYPYCTGGKKGYTLKAGKSLVSSATKNNTNLIIVTLKDNNKYETHKNLYEKYFFLYKKYRIVKKNKNIVKDKKYYKNYKLYVKKDINIAISEEEKDKISIIYKLKNKKQKNNIAGSIYIYIDNNLIVKQNIYAKRKIFNFFK